MLQLRMQLDMTQFPTCLQAVVSQLSEVQLLVADMHVSDWVLSWEFQFQCQKIGIPLTAHFQYIWSSVYMNAQIGNHHT